MTKHKNLITRKRIGGRAYSYLGYPLQEGHVIVDTNTNKEYESFEAYEKDIAPKPKPKVAVRKKAVAKKKEV